MKNPLGRLLCLFRRHAWTPWDVVERDNAQTTFFRACSRRGCYEHEFRYEYPANHRTWQDPQP